jgi:hypothetical protein
MMITGFNWFTLEVVARSSEHINESSGPIKGWVLLG